MTYTNPRPRSIDSRTLLTKLMLRFIMKEAGMRARTMSTITFQAIYHRSASGLA